MKKYFIQVTKGSIVPWTPNSHKPLQTSCGGPDLVFDVKATRTFEEGLEFRVYRV